MKAKILTTIPIKQEWLDEVREHIPDIEFEIVPTTEKLQIWYNPQTKTFYGVFDHLRQLVNAPTGYRYRVYNMSDQERQNLGMSDHFAAYDNRDRDGVLDFYMGVPERIQERTRLNGFRSNWARVFIHECLHGKEQEIGREYLAEANPDRTHEWQANGKLKELIAEHFKIKELQKQLSFLQQLLSSLLRSRETIIRPIDASITQPYGVSNPRYPLTRHHIGTDYNTVVGTPVKMPVDGRVIISSFSPALGNFCVIEYTYKGQKYQSRFAHLEQLPRTGERKKGEVFCYTGNTGDSTGPHLHVDVWRNAVNLVGINSRNFRERTVDPELHYQS